MCNSKLKNLIVLDVIKNFDKGISTDLQIKTSIKKRKIKDSDVFRFFSFHFPNGIEGVIENFNFLINEELDKTANKKLDKLRVNEKITKLILTRLEILENYKNGLINLNSYLLRNGKIIISNKLLFKVADFIWNLAGDRSLDFNYYSKRLILMKVYLFSFNYWLRDESKDFNLTKRFTENQIRNVLKIGMIKKNIKVFLNKKFNFSSL